MSAENPTHNPTAHDPDTPEYRHPTGGWGSLEGLSLVAGRAAPSLDALDTLRRQNKPGGFMCTSCAWAKPPTPHLAEFCENGAKATLWELTTDRCTPEFFAAHTVAELRGWRDYDLEMQGRLTHPLRYDAVSDRYVPVAWEEAFAAIGRELQALPVKDVVFYASGHASLEASYLYALFARMYGNNNLPDSSNMCHETTSVGLKKVTGSPVGTCVLEDFDHCDALFFFGQNTGTNSPRFLHNLKDCVDRGVKIVTFNPVRERGLIEFTDPQNPIQMTVGKPTPISSQFYQVRPGGDIAVLMGIARLALEREDAEGGILDHAFIAEHTKGFEEFAAAARAADWDEIERMSGLSREMIRAAAEVYLAAKKVIIIYGMGITQHVRGGQSIGAMVNLLLMRGMIGQPGTGISPVRGHSNVQGQRTVGITEKPELAPNDKYRELYGFEPPAEKGVGTVEMCEGILAGRIKAVIQLGGNLVRAVPDRERVAAKWGEMRLTVNIATKLNHSHLHPGTVAYLLPCLGRSEEDVQATGRQAVSIEDSLSHIYGSLARARPASPELRSEIAIVAALATATLAPNPKVPWDAWVGDYALIRDAIEATYPDKFKDFNRQLFRPGGFYKGNPARQHRWETDSGKAEFTTPAALTALGVGDAEGRFHLITLRSNDQFNTTIYGFHDRLRGLSGSRDVLLINRDDMARAGLAEGQVVTLATDMGDGIDRRVGGLTVTAFDLPAGAVAGYYPELNPLVPLSYHEEMSRTPAYKGVPVRIVA